MPKKAGAQPKAPEQQERAQQQSPAVNGPGGSPEAPGTSGTSGLQVEAGPAGEAALPAAAASNAGVAAGLSSHAAIQQRLLQDEFRAVQLHQQQRSDVPKDHYAFWRTQPVVQFGEQGAPGSEAVEGPINPPQSVDEVRQTPLKLPDSFEWSTCDLDDVAVVEEVYQLLRNNYVEDDDNMFRFNYSQAFLRWALQPPGYNPEWIVGVRQASNRRLVGFITAVGAAIRTGPQAAAGLANGEAAGPPAQQERVQGGESRGGAGAQGEEQRGGRAPVPMVEINFLCVHKKLRSKRLAPVLIREVTRRVNAAGVWQAAYTAGVLLPSPVTVAQYWHRPLDVRKLLAVGFSRLAPRMTLARTLKLNWLPDEPATPGLRPFREGDVKQVAALLAAHLAPYALAPVFSEAEVLHYLLPVPGVIDTRVVEAPDGRITDLVSFYTLPSTVIGCPQYDTLRAAFQYYTLATATPLAALQQDALILAKASGHDVFNALDIFQNETFLKDLKFGIGDGKLRYYLFNWRMPRQLEPREVGLVLL